VTTDVSGVRDYYPGDSFNRIHWASTARTGRLIVKEFELDPTADVWLLLDMQGAVQAERGWGQEARELPVVGVTRTVLPPSTEEYVVSIAASLARHFLARSRAVGLVAYGQKREYIAADRGERQLNKIMEALAVLRAVGTVPMAQIIGAEAKSLGRNTTAVAITPSDDVGWVERLRDARRRGIFGLAVLVDPVSFGKPVDTAGLIPALTASGIYHFRVREGDRLEEALSLAGVSAG